MGEGSCTWELLPLLRVALTPLLRGVALAPLLRILLASLLRGVALAGLTALRRVAALLTCVQDNKTYMQFRLQA